MSKKTLLAILTALVVTAPAFAEEHAHGDVAVARAILKEILADDSAYVAAHNAAFFQELAKGQHPRATVVTCSDSRVQTNTLDKTPESDLFVVRNIGNQLATAKGSVQYGVNHLASSLLIFVGHSSCGAIKAASGDYSGLEPDIKKELDTISIPKGISNIDGVKANVNNQVAAAVKEWNGKIEEGHLMVVGAVYDFADDMKEGSGKLNIINVNGETDPAKIKASLDK
ncbi:MAG: carbonic anhydrase [Candidatus Competibacter sp.]